MHKVSRTLLLAGVVAFGTLTAACGDKVTVTSVGPIIGVQSVTVTPANATIPAGTTITLSASVLADASTAKTVSWTSSNAGVATVDATGKVTGSSTIGGTVTIIATATADASKSGAAAIVVTAPAPPAQPVIPTISIGGVNNTVGGVSVPVNLSNVAGQIDVTVNTTGGGNVDLFIAPAANCATNTIATNDKLVTSQLTSAQSGAVTLSYNTATLNANNTPVFTNGSYCIKARLTPATGAAVVATNTAPITLNNASFYKATLAFVSTTSGPTSAVSTLNGLNYNQGTLTATITAVNYTTGSPVALISGNLGLTGTQGGGAAPAAVAFTNVAVTAGVATVVFTDTANSIPGNFAGVNSIAQHTSSIAGDALTVTSATDAAGNPVVATPLVATGIRIDNDFPTLATSYAVTAPNGYIGAAYKFSSGTTGGSLSGDWKNPVLPSQAGTPGVGGVTTTYYVGAAASAAFATVNSCNITGLTPATVGTDLANTTATNADQAKVVVKDALGNQICMDAPSTFVGGGGLFGVDKIAPSVTLLAAAGSAADQTGYSSTRNWSFVYNDTISGFNPALPFKGTLTRNFFVNNGSATDCVIGTYSGTALTCAAVAFGPTATFGTPPNAGGSIEFTNGTLVNGYYTINTIVVDRAGNTSTAVVATAAYDANTPTVGTISQSPAAAASLGTVSVSAPVTDGVGGLDLKSSSGRLSYAPAGFALASVPFASVTGTSFGPNFDATFVTSGTATVALSNIYRGLQGVDAGNNIIANQAAPQANITVTNVGGVSFTPAATTTIVMSGTPGNILINVAPNQFIGTPTSGAPATSQATTTLTIRVVGAVSDPAFQSQPFAQIDIYKFGTSMALVGTNTLASVTDVGTVRTYTYITSGVALTAAATNNFYAIGRNAAGDAVISNAITVVNP